MQVDSMIMHITENETNHISSIKHLIYPSEVRVNLTKIHLSEILGNCFYQTETTEGFLAITNYDRYRKLGSRRHCSSARNVRTVLRLTNVDFLFQLQGTNACLMVNLKKQTVPISQHRLHYMKLEPCEDIENANYFKTRLLALLIGKFSTVRTYTYKALQAVRQT